MRKLRQIPLPSIIISCLAIFLINLLLLSTPALAVTPPSPVLFPAQQQDEEPKEQTAGLGENRGEVSEGSSQIWTYEAQAGDVLTIKAEADKPANDAEDRTGLLDMLLIVYAPDGTILAKADDIQPAVVTDAVIEGLALPTDGTYKIEVLGLQKEGSGAYTLTVQAASTTLPEPTPTINPYLPTLTIENQLEEPICFVYISPYSSDSWGTDWLAEEVISPNDSRQWYVESDIYDILLSDCYGNTLDRRREFDVTESSTLKVLPLDGPVTQCAKGVELLFDDKSADALPLLEAGFAGRESATFADPDDEGICALALGLLRDRTGNRSGALETYQVARYIFQASGNRELEGDTLNDIGAVYDDQGQYELALEQFQQALEIMREVGDRAGEGTTLNNIGSIYRAQQKYSEALAYYKQALEIRREVGNRASEGTTLSNIGAVYDDEGKYSEALAYYEQALEIFREVGDRAGEGVTANNIGLVYSHQGKYSEALAYYEQALEIKREVGKRLGEGITLNNIGLVYDDEGKYSEALAYYEQALEIFREVGDHAGEGVTANNIGLVYRAQGKYSEALEQLQKSLEIRRDANAGDRAGEGTTLSNIGLVYDDQGKYSEALTYYEQALEIFREVGDNACEGTIFNNIAAVYSNQVNSSEALAYYEQALEIILKVGDRAGEGTMANNIGLVYRTQGKYSEALAYYKQALEIRREVGDRAGEGTTLSNIGAVYDYQGKYSEALEQLQKALEIIREVGDRAGEGTTLSNIGAVYDNQGKYSEALAYYEQALEIIREVGDRAGEGITLNNIGAVYDNQGKYEDALEELHKALEIIREVGERTGEGTTLSNIGGVYDNQGKYSEALAYYKQALKIFREVGDRTGEGATLNNIGTVYDNQGKYSEALAYYEQALEIRREVGHRAGEGTTLNNIGFIYSNQGKYEQALLLYQQALDIRREVGDRAGEGGTANNIGAVYYNQGKYEDALLQYQEALLIIREVGDRAGEGTTLNNIGVVYEQQGQAEEALLYYEQAMDVFESVRATAGGEEERASFIAQYAVVYDRAIGLYHEPGQNEAAFLTSERGRARSFLDSLATGEVQLSDDNLQALIEQERDAYEQRFAIRDKLIRARAQNPPDTELVADLEARFTEAEEAYNKVQAEIEARGGQLEELIPGRSTVLKLPEVQELLDEQTTLVSYWLLADEGTLAFIITQDSFVVVELPEATIDKLQSTLTALYEWPSLENPSPDTLKELHQWLIAPLEQHLDTPQVGIIPHQLLHYVPFAALTDGDGYFGEQHTLFVLPSASALQRIQETVAETAQAEKQPALVFGNPTTSEELELSPLHGAASEARAVAELLGVPAYLADEASEERLWSAANNAQVLHLSAHGVYVTTNPFYNSAVFLASSHDGKGHSDGRLEVAEVYGLDLTATELVVLSACETSINDLSARDEVAVSASDEVVGLTRAFLFAGTPTVVASLWPVDDESTKELMVSFYRHWQEEGMSKGEALAAAQAEIREKYPSPYYWAGFVLSGSPGESTASVDRSGWWLLIVAATILLVGGWVISRRRRA